MGFDLSGRGGYFRWTSSGWDALLELAQEYGWSPIGTGAPRGIRKKEWGGNYTSNDGQLFYARDAKNFAVALERFLAEIHAKTPPRKLQHSTKSEYTTSPARKSLREFITYCRQGSFRLH